MFITQDCPSSSAKYREMRIHACQCRIQNRRISSSGLDSVCLLYTSLANYLQVPFVQEVIAVSTSLQELAPKTDVAIELGGEDAKIIYFENGNVEQRMNGICAGGTGSFIDQMASLLQTDAAGLNE